ncbi:MAG: hypothetical protein B6D55_02500 [Candidatus Omnitrophica bacterium 4484_70.2]|nr:MAG: hypothetical protein B6D55_02500 [Candidatus Omnitrophica bacterium 4484_70.2]
MRKIVLGLFLYLILSTSLALGYKKGRDIFEPKVSKEEAQILSKAIELSKKDLEEAIKFLSSKIGFESSAALDFALGVLYHQRGEFEESKLCYKRALEKFPYFHRARANLAQILLEEGKIDEAKEELSIVLKESKVPPHLYTLTGYIFLLKGNPVAAEIAYKNAILLKPEDTNAYLGLVKSLIMQEKFKEAEKLIKPLLEKDYTKKELWFTLVDIYLSLNDFDKAIITLELAKRINIDLGSDVYFTLGDLFLNQGMPQEALFNYKKALTEKGLSFDRLLKAIEGFIICKDLKEAKDLIERAERIKKDLEVGESQRKKLRILRAKYYYLNKEFDLSLKIYKEILEKDPTNAEVLLCIGDIYKEEGDLKEALLFYERASNMGRKIEALMKRAQIEVELGNYSKAIDLLKEVQSIKPQGFVEKYIKSLQQLENLGD